MTKNNSSKFKMHSFTARTKLMGNLFEFTANHSDLELCKNAVKAGIIEVQRIEALLTTFSTDSYTSKINDKAGIFPLKVPQELVNLIQRSQKISQLTDGAFDISYGSISKDFWNFNTDMPALPNPKEAVKATKLVNYRNIIINESESSVFLSQVGMRIGFGGIGKGYSADRAKIIMHNMGIEHGVVNASGDLTAWGFQQNGNNRSIGIADPNYRNNIVGKFDINNSSVATSGDYEKFIIIDGKRYSHTIHPRTGMPAEGLKSVTIMAPYAELCDALTTPIIIMGADAGLHLINQLKEVEAVIIDNNNKIYFSENIKIK